MISWKPAVMWLQEPFLFDLEKGVFQNTLKKVILCQTSLEKGMCGRGGARHHSKPYIETGLLFKCLKKHEYLVVEMKGYEVLSSNSGVGPRAMMHMLPLASDLVELEPACEIHPQPLRACLLQMITDKPDLNTSKCKGSVFVNLRAGRLGILLCHVRKLCRGFGVQACVSNLTGLEYTWLQDTLKKAPTQCMLLEKGRWGREPLKKEAKKLKKTVSDVSLDSDGWPKLLTSPKKSEEASPPRLWRKKGWGHRPAKQRILKQQTMPI